MHSLIVFLTVLIVFLFGICFYLLEKVRQLRRWTYSDWASMPRYRVLEKEIERIDDDHYKLQSQLGMLASALGLQYVNRDNIEHVEGFFKKDSKEVKDQPPCTIGHGGAKGKSGRM